MQRGTAPQTHPVSLTGHWPEHPVIYEINTATWLTQLSRRHERSVTLANVPAENWAAVTPPGVDAVWLMGVWERSPAGRHIALSDAQLMDSFPGRATGSERE